MSTLKDIQARKAAHANTDDQSWRTASFGKAVTQHTPGMGAPPPPKGFEPEIEQLAAAVPGRVGLISRCAIHIADAIIVTLLFQGLLLVLQSSGLLSAMRAGNAGLLVFGLQLCINSLWFIILPCIMKATPMQLVAGLEIINHSTGHPAGALRIIARAILFGVLPLLALAVSVFSIFAAFVGLDSDFLAMIALILLVLPLGTALFSPYGRCLHDILTGTRLRKRQSVPSFS